MNNKYDLTSFETYLKDRGLSKNTVKSYICAVDNYFGLFDKISQKNLLAFKGHLVENYKPRSVNLKVQAINSFLKFERSALKLSAVKFAQKSYIENVISEADYEFLKDKLRRDGDKRGYFLVRFLAATGARISELLELKTEHIYCGYYDIYSKGGKMRRIFIPEELRKEALVAIEDGTIKSGYLFVNRSNGRITARGVAMLLQQYARKYGINPAVMHPHSFRHRFAKNFIEKYNDIALLADLMGHESIETTRIYLRKTATEQQSIVNKVVTW